MGILLDEANKLYGGNTGEDTEEDVGSFSDFADSLGFERRDLQAERAENIENKGNFMRGLASGWDSTVGLLGGAVGIAGDALDNDSVRNWGFDVYQDRMKEAELNPVDVSNVEDIDSIESAGDWFAGTIGQLAPSMGEALVSTLVGGGVSGLAGRTLAKEAIEAAVEKQVANGVKRSVANQIVKSKIYDIGAKIGTVAGTGALEGGGMWGEDAQAHGVENANAGSAAALGLVSGASELYSPGGALVQRIAGVKGAGSAVADKISDSFLKRLGTEIPKQMGEEAAQEVFQSFVGILNKKINDPLVSLTDKKAISEYLNSAAGGAAGGLLFGGTTAAFPESKEIREKEPFNMFTPEKTAADLDVSDDEYHTVDDVFLERDSTRAVGRAINKDMMGFEADAMGETMDDIKFNHESDTYRRGSNKTGTIDENEKAFERGLMQGGYAGYEPELPPLTKAGYDPLLGDWADNSVSLAQDEEARGRRNAPKALPPGGQFELTGEPFGEKDGLPSSTHEKINVAKTAADSRDLGAAFAKMKEQLKGSDKAGESYDLETIKSASAEMADSDDHITRYPSTNPGWLKLKTLQALDKKNQTNLAKDVNKATVLHVFNLVDQGKPLSEKQQRVFDYLKTVAEDDVDTRAGREYSKLEAEGFEFNKPEVVAAGSLKPGDQVVLQKNGVPDKVTHKGFDKDGNAILKDGVTLHVDPFEQIEIHARKDGESGPDPADEEKLFNLLGQINEKGTREDLKNIKDELPAYLEKFPKMAPYQEMISGAIERRASVLDEDFRKTAPGSRMQAEIARLKGKGSGVQEGNRSDSEAVNSPAAGSNIAENPAGGELISPAAEVPNTERHEVIDNPDSLSHGHEVNTSPSEAQKEAGNYKKAHVSVDGMDISIENPAGTTRKGVDKDGKAWESEMKADYGYIKGSVGYDKDHVDVFMAHGYQGGAKDAYVVNQHSKDGKFDEHKVVIGASSEKEAMEIYNSNYEAGWDGGKSVAKMPMEKFKEWAKSDGPKAGPAKTGLQEDIARLKGRKETVDTGSGVKMEVVSSFDNESDNMKSEVLKNPDTGKFHAVLTDLDSGKVAGVTIHDTVEAATEKAKEYINNTPSASTEKASAPQGVTSQRQGGTQEGISRGKFRKDLEMRGAARTEQGVTFRILARNDGYYSVEKTEDGNRTTLFDNENLDMATAREKTIEAAYTSLGMDNPDQGDYDTSEKVNADSSNQGEHEETPTKKGIVGEVEKVKSRAGTSPAKGKTEGVPLSEITVSYEGQDANGDIYDFENIPADEALKEADEDIQKMYELLGCLQA